MRSLRTGPGLPAAAVVAAVACLPAVAGTPTPDAWAHSCYAYRDVNRNGVFDLGDRPYAGLPLEVTHPDGTVSLETSNIDGFANLGVSLGDPENALIYAPGDYRITARLPDGWMSTSDRHEQVLTFVARANAGGGLVPAETCAPIGVAPVLTVRGRFVPPDGASVDDISVTASGPGGRAADVGVDADGRFAFSAAQGRWEVAFADRRSGQARARTVMVEDAAVVMADVRLGGERPTAAGSAYEVIDFDHLLISDSLFEIPSGYGGLAWRNWIAVHDRHYVGAGYINATVSSDYAAYNSSGAPAAFWSAEPFDFVGVHVGMAWPRGREDDVIVRAWRGSDLVHEDRLRLSDAGAVYFDADYAGVTRVEFSSGNYERIVIDDLRVRRRR